MTIKIKLLGLVAGAILSLLVIALVGLHGLNKNTTSIEDIGGNRMPSVDSLLVVREAITDLSRNLYAVISAERQTTLDKKRGELQVAYKRKLDATQRASEAIKRYESLPSDAEEQALYAKFSAAWKDWLALEMQMQQLHKTVLDELTDEGVRRAADEHQKMAERRGV